MTIAQSILDKIHKHELLEDEAIMLAVEYIDYETDENNYDFGCIYADKSELRFCTYGIDVINH